MDLASDSSESPLEELPSTISLPWNRRPSPERSLKVSLSFEKYFCLTNIFYRSAQYFLEGPAIFLHRGSPLHHVLSHLHGDREGTRQVEIETVTVQSCVQSVLSSLLSAVSLTFNLLHCRLQRKQPGQFDHET